MFSPDAFVESALSPTRLREVRDRLNWDVSLSELEDQVDVWLEGKAAMYIVGQAGTADEAQALAQTTLDVFLAGQANFNAQKWKRLAEENRTSIERAKERRQEANQAYDVFPGEEWQTGT